MGMPVITPSETTRCQSITDIIESVALEQTALSHILNAEGEKLQRVILDDTTTSEELLKFNESVKTMVEAITELEKILQSKLGLFSACLCDCEDTAGEVVPDDTNTP